jgi:hypothetical protein
LRAQDLRLDARRALHRRDQRSGIEVRKTLDHLPVAQRDAVAAVEPDPPAPDRALEPQLN